jgi:diacylglycerol kinase family enzyme
LTTIEGDRRPSGVERVSAIIALLTLAFAILAVIVGVGQHLGYVITSMFCLAILSLAGWYIVSRAGMIRLIAAVVGAAALVAAILVFFASDTQLWRALTALAAVAVSVGATRRALRPPEATTGMPRPAGSTSSRPVLLMNPKSGGGKVGKFNLVEECKKRGIEPIVLRPGDDLLKLAREAVASGADVVGMAGGDGSQALIATVATKHGIPLVVIPAGTRNHFALDLGLDRDDVVGALDAFTDGVESSIDLAMVNGRVFVNNASAGIYARIVQSPEYRDAKLQTAAQMLPQILGPDAEPLALRFTGPDGTDYPSAHLILVSNNPYHLSTLAGAGIRERLDLGVLGILAARISNAREWQEFVALEAVGRVDRFPGWIEWQAPKFEIRSSGPVEIGVDGEALKMDPPLVFESMPLVLRVRRPVRALSSSAEAKRRILARSTIADLGRIAAGRATASAR